MHSPTTSDGDVDVRLFGADSGGGSYDSGSGGGSGRGAGGSSGSDSGSVDRTGDGTGGDYPGSDGTGAGTGKRRRGRPRKVTELAGALPDPTLVDPEKPKRGRRKGPDLSVLVETTVVGLFGLVAVATAHEHWLKDREEVMAITGPLNAWIDQLDAKTLKKIEKNLAPTLLVVGVATVIGPDVVMEARLRARDKNARRSVSGPPSPFGLRPPIERAPGGIESPGNGADGGSGSAGGWHSSVPASAPLGFDTDV